MMTKQPVYFNAYSTLRLSRTPLGVVTLRFHTDDGPAAFSGPMQREWPQALYEISEDPDNRVLVITGTGDRFMTDIDQQSLGDLTKPAVWEGIFSRGRQGMQRLVDLEMPLIAAVNGPVSIHSEWAMACDIVIAANTTVFSDYSHPAFGTVPGDGVALVWEEVLGLNRSRHLTLTGGSFTAQQALDWGVVAEVKPLEHVVPRAQELAEQLAVKSALLTRFLAVTVRHRLSRRVAEAVPLTLGLEGLAASNKAYESSSE